MGCQMNRSDAERIQTVLDGMGLVAATDGDDDDITVKGIVACSVRQKAIDRVYGKIRLWNESKNETALITFLTGCVLPADRKKFLKLFDLVFTIDQLPILPEFIRQYGIPTPIGLSHDFFRRHGEPEAGTPAADGADGREHPQFDGNASSITRQGMEKHWHVKPSYSSSVEAYVPIQNGCDKFCSFCAVPYTRGREISRSSDDILAEVGRLAAAGYKSIILLGQNVNSYGLDRMGAELTFPQLLEEIGEIGRQNRNDFWVYFTSPHPRDVSKELLEVMAAYPVLADWLHLPLQSGNDEVLRRMNRNYTMEHCREVVKNLRAILPDAALFTDIIVGFSGESDEQFQDSAQAMEEFRFDMAYIARYSPRPGARSALWEDDVSGKEKERRFRILSKLLLDSMAPINAARVGQVIRVLVTSRNPRTGYLTGHSEGRIPVRLEADDSTIGTFVNLKVTSAKPLSISGELS